MRAEAAGYSPDVIALLDGLAARAHNTLYSAPPYRLRAVWELIAADFPRTLRRYGRFFALAAGAVPAARRARLRRRAALARVRAPHPARRHGRADGEGLRRGLRQGPRAAAPTRAMTGFYVYNNVGIAFRCFATGVLFGLGSVFFLVYNGLTIGAVAGLVTAAGSRQEPADVHLHARRVRAHGHRDLRRPPGMVMGYALVDTRRPHALRIAARARARHRLPGDGRRADAAGGGGDRRLLVAVGRPRAA